jgi:anthranilate phosphoribosyltransferase
MKTLFKDLTRGYVLTEAEAQQLMDGILNDEMSAEQIGFMLACLEFRGPTGGELAGFTKALLQKSVSLDPQSDTMIDVCGTGGDGLGMFNVSTSVAFVVAGAGLKVAKHGNRAVSSRCGSFDVLEALDIPFSQNSLEAQHSLNTKGLTFLYAPAFHPVLGKLAVIRRNLGVRTIFNALGPLLNPARVKRQLIGVYSQRLLTPMAEALNLLGTDEAMIVHGEDGSDEISLSSKTQVAHLKSGKISYSTIDPRELGFDPVDNNSLAGGHVIENANILLNILSGTLGPHRDMTVLNAGAALFVAGRASSHQEGIKLACKSIDSGHAMSMLKLQQVSGDKRLVV